MQSVRTHPNRVKDNGQLLPRLEAELADQLPSALELEMGVIGSLFHEPKVLLEVRRILEGPTDFSNTAHAAIYQAAVELYEQDEHIDIGLLHQRLKDRDLLGKVGGTEYLVQLVESVPSATAASYWAQIVRDKALLRKAIEATCSLLREAIDTADAARIEEHVDQLRQITEARATGAPQHLVFQTLDKVEPKPVRWQWRGRIVLGALNILCGDPGVGKSFASMDIAARVTTGTPWPCGDSVNEAGSVIILAAEDDSETTIAPRLQAAGANMDKVAVIEGVRRLDGNGRNGVAFFDLGRDLRHLTEALNTLPDARLLIVDPLDSYLGDVDSHVNAAIRGLLAPLNIWAAEHGVGVLAIKHLNKTSSTKSVQRITGSIAFTAAARSVWLVARDDDDPARRIMAPVKMNLAPEPKAAAFAIRPCSENNDIGVVAWEAGELDATADDLLDGQTGAKTQEAVQFLYDHLPPDGREVSAAEIRTKAEKAGIAYRTLARAKRELSVEAVRPENPGPWFWRIPARAR